MSCASRDFATLAGTYDLLLHRHEDPFDIKRIERALDQAGLRMLSFDLPLPPVAARYDAMFPDDPKHRDIKSWARFELSERSLRNFRATTGSGASFHQIPSEPLPYEYLNAEIRSR